MESKINDEENITVEINREELEKKVLKAASPEEVMEIIRAGGEEITEEEAKQLFVRAQGRKEDKTLSLDELESVSGGSRDWSTEGCAATCELESDCWGTDRCVNFNVVYTNFPYKLCTYCARGDVEFIGLDADLMRIYRCKRCGFEKKYKGIEYTSAH